MRENLKYVNHKNILRIYIYENEIYVQDDAQKLIYK